jgi:hypothetical protein
MYLVFQSGKYATELREIFMYGLDFCSLNEGRTLYWQKLYIIYMG